jgi:hypothetical protein
VAKVQGDCALAKQTMRTESDKAAVFEKRNLELEAQLKSVAAEVRPAMFLILVDA